MALTWFFFYLVFSLVIMYRSVEPLVWDIVSCIYLVAATFFIGFPPFSGIIIWIFVASVIAIHRLDEVRLFISDFLYKRAERSIPKISKTEATALDLGDSWFEKDIFRGEPNWDRLSEISTELSVCEQDFLANETNELCKMLNDWSNAQNEDLPGEVWDYIKQKGFLGLVIPKEYGGKGFSARAHSDIVMKIASRSGVAAVTVMVPNSLGPGELLLHYGTEDQKKYYLPRLASGQEIPCFALTEPEAGSDATSIKSEAVVCHKTIGSKKVLGFKICINKRWITLAPIATLIGLAVNLKDPENLLHGSGSEGITCILMSKDTENLEIGNRHLPAHLPLMNGTIRGVDIFLPITSIIGGQKMAGHGWEMLVECLSIGRAISLPALSAAAAGVSYLTSGAYAKVRRQFGVEIGKFEGVAEKLAEISGLNYLINSTRLLTLAAVNEGKRPAVASAITKYFNTELARKCVTHAMDIHGGRSIVLGPRNYLADYYCSMPVYITVEGANIMTRNLLIFSQGAMAAHPFIRDEISLVNEKDKEAFNVVIWQHISYFMRNFARAFCSGLTGGWFIHAPENRLKIQYKKLTRLSYAFAWLSDIALITLGGSLKQKERLSARLADGMSYLYIAAAALHKAVDIDKNDDSILHAKWGSQYCFYHAQKSLLELCHNFPNRILGKLIGFLVFPFGQIMKLPDDATDAQMAKLMMEKNLYRESLLSDLYLSGNKDEPIDRVLYAFDLILKHSDLYTKAGKINHLKPEELMNYLQEKVLAKELSQAELESIIMVEQARWDAILVDEFSKESINDKTFTPIISQSFGQR